MTYDLKKDVDDYEAARISVAMSRCDQNKTEAAKMLGIKRTTLLMKLKKIEDNEKTTG